MIPIVTGPGKIRPFKRDDNKEEKRNERIFTIKRTEPKKQDEEEKFDNKA